LWQTINGNQSLKKGRIRLQEFSTVVLYGQRKFCSNSARFCAKPCERATIGLPSVSGAMQHYENVWKTSLVNYKSAALPGELCRRRLRGQSVAIEFEKSSALPDMLGNRRILTDSF
jgi:hypothetical protein